MLPNYGVAPTADRAAWELRLSHWSGRCAELELWTDWSYRRFHHLYGRLTYRGGGVYGFRSTRFGVPLDTYGRNVFVDTFGSTYGSGWKRENSFLTHKPTGGFCYGFYPHGPHPVGNGKKYRATVIGPGVTPDVMWEGPAPGAYDSAVDAQANDAQRALLGGRSALQDQLGAREQQYLVLAIVLALWLLAHCRRTGILVRMPAPLKEALVRETARRGSNVNDVAAGILAEQLRRPVRAERPPSQSASRLQPRPPPPRSAGAEGRDPRRGVASRHQRERRHPRRAHRRARRPTREQAKGHHGRDQRLQERQRPHEGQGAGRDHRRRQLRQLPPPGRRVLQGRRPGRVRARSHARRPRRLPHLRHRVHRRLRRRQGQGRRGPRRRDLGAPERHDQVRQGPQDAGSRSPAA